MKTIEIELDEQTIERAQRLAAARGGSLHTLIKDLLEQAHESGTARQSAIGMFASEPELMDEVVESAMRAREERPLRRSGG